MSHSPKFIEIEIPEDIGGFLRQTTVPFLKALAPDAKPLWGLMRGQHMVEHLIYILENSRGVREIPLLIPEEKLPRYKGFLMSNYGFTRNFKFPMLPEEQTVPLVFADMKTAMAAYEAELQAFFRYIDDPAFTVAPHPFYGDMIREEALMFQYKHHLHHMMQFGYSA